MMTQRRTLIRTRDLASFRAALADLALDGISALERVLQLRELVSHAPG